MMMVKQREDLVQRLMDKNLITNLMISRLMSMIVKKQNLMRRKTKSTLWVEVLHQDKIHRSSNNSRRQLEGNHKIKEQNQWVDNKKEEMMKMMMMIKKFQELIIQVIMQVLLSEVMSKSFLNISKDINLKRLIWIQSSNLSFLIMFQPLEKQMHSSR